MTNIPAMRIEGVDIKAASPKERMSKTVLVV
jgi:hypothetical protein